MSNKELNSPQLQKIQTGCLFLLTVIAVCVTLYFLKPVFIPFILAVFFTYCLTPVIDVQIKYLKFPRLLAIISTILLGCLLLILLGYLFSVSVNQITANSDEYRARSKELFNLTVDRVPFEKVGIDREEWKTSLFDNSDKTIKSVISGMINGFLNVLSKGLLVLIFMIFLLIGKKRKKSPKTDGIFNKVESRIKSYIINMVLISGGTGILVGTTLSILKVEFAFMFGFLAFLLNFIPSIGSIIATLLPLPVILINPELSMPVKILAITIPAIIQFLIGNLLAPKVMGDSLQLHPIAVLMALIFFGIIWGIVGMFLATPITAVIKICLERNDFTRPFANLLAGNLDDFDRH